MVKPMPRQTISPITVAMIPYWPTPVGELARRKLWAKAAPTIMPNDKDGGVAVTFSGHEKLAAGAAAGQGKGQTGQHHAAEIP